jgi:hypothetical protein
VALVVATAAQSAEAARRPWAAGARRAVHAALALQYPSAQEIYAKCTRVSAHRFKCGWTVFYDNYNGEDGGTAYATKHQRWDVTQLEVLCTGSPSCALYSE